MSASDNGCKGRWCHVKSRAPALRCGSNSHVDVMTFVMFVIFEILILIYERFLMQTRWKIPGSLHGLSIIEMTVFNCFVLCFFAFHFSPAWKKSFPPNDAVLLLLPLLLSATEAVPQSLGTTCARKITSMHSDMDQGCRPRARAKIVTENDEALGESCSAKGGSRSRQHQH